MYVTHGKWTSYLPYFRRQIVAVLQFNQLVCLSTGKHVMWISCCSWATPPSLSWPLWPSGVKAQVCTTTCTLLRPSLRWSSWSTLPGRRPRAWSEFSSTNNSSQSSLCVVGVKLFCFSPQLPACQIHHPQRSEEQQYPFETFHSVSCSFCHQN